MRFLPSWLGHSYDLEILFEKIVYFEYKYRQDVLVLNVRSLIR